MKRAMIGFLVVLAVFSFTPTVRAVDAPWPMLRHDAQGAGMSHYVGPSEPTIKWTLEPSAYGSVNGLAIRADGTIYVAGYDDAFYAVNPDGTVKWRVDINFCEVNIAFVHSPAIGPDGTIYVRGDVYSHLLALDPADGHERWRVDVNAGYGPPVVGNDGVIYIADDTSPGSLYAINPDGTIKWHVQDVGGQGPQVALSPDGLRVYSNSYDGFTCLNALDGSIVWQNREDGKGYLPAVGPDGVIYANVEPEWNEYQFAAINPADGSLKWSLDIGLFRPGSRPAIDAGRRVVYVASGGDDHLYAISFSGDVKWAFACDVGDNDMASIGGDGTVYINGDGCIIAVDPDSGEEKWRIKPPSSLGSVPPVIGTDGTLYVPTWNMVLVAIGEQTRTLYEGHEYFFLHKTMTWHDAKAHAESLGGHLVTINNNDENDFLLDLEEKQGLAGDEFWIGLTDEAVEGDFAWVTGEPLDYTNWYPGQPGPEDYTVYRFLHWYTREADELKQFVVEFEGISKALCGDVNVNGRVDIGDAMFIAQYLVGNRDCLCIGTGLEVCAPK